jgi:S-formylglutathione hydrolase FrmB
LYAAFNNLDEFTYVGVFSGGIPLLPGVLINITMPPDAANRRGPDVGHSVDPAKFAALLPALGPDVNKKLHLFYLTIGTDDGLVESWQDARKVFDQKGVKYTWVELPGYGHEWSFWRLALQDFSSRLFKDTK